MDSSKVILKSWYRIAIFTIKLFIVKCNWMQLLHFWKHLCFSLWNICWKMPIYQSLRFDSVEKYFFKRNIWQFKWESGLNWTFILVMAHINFSEFFFSLLVYLYIATVWLLSETIMCMMWISSEHCVEHINCNVLSNNSEVLNQNK